MYPEETARLIPLLESAALGKPHGGFTGVDYPSNNVVFRRIWR
jgi:hypothetical protein